MAWGYWWVLAVSNLWWTIVFPARKHFIFNNSKKLHFIQSLVAWGIPTVLVGTVFAVDGQYATGILTPDFCSPPSRNVNYYTYAMPTQINVGIAGSLLILICYKLRKQVSIFSISSTITENSIWWELDKTTLFYFILSCPEQEFYRISTRHKKAPACGASWVFCCYCACTHHLHGEISAVRQTHCLCGHLSGLYSVLSKGCMSTTVSRTHSHQFDDDHRLCLAIFLSFSYDISLVLQRCQTAMV